MLEAGSTRDRGPWSPVYRLKLDGRINPRYLDSLVVGMLLSKGAHRQLKIDEVYLLWYIDMQGTVGLLKFTA